MSEVLEVVRMVGGDWVRFRNVRYSSQMGTEGSQDHCTQGSFPNS
jgi:hypothetical protein